MKAVAQASLEQVVAELEGERRTLDVLRDYARHVDQEQRVISMQLSQVYSLPLSDLPRHTMQVALAFGDLRAALHTLAEHIPPHEYYKTVPQLFLDVQDYLHGVISVFGELPRLAMNAVTSGNFDEPVRISVFAKQLYSAFQVLNLKNDVLRKRFDGLKYDMKRIEEVIYDIQLRGLIQNARSTEDSDTNAIAPDALLAQMQGQK
ncbi:Translin-1 [Malassezia vespertilionis]|uniref:Translin-1 n=1 Tax=Malassezia vespertilionis TaxID=2020962 RepID=UPI0024B1351B|nr:Translin-1 [Malassezia vespertilionis]WFD05138.1 Translin-1 [Malassezia vespertilionis]